MSEPILEFCRVCDCRRWSNNKDRLLKHFVRNECQGEHEWTSLENQAAKAALDPYKDIFVDDRTNEERKIPKDVSCISVEVHFGNLSFGTITSKHGFQVRGQYLGWARSGWLHSPEWMKDERQVLLGNIPCGPDMPWQVLADALQQLLENAGLRYGI